MGEMYRLNWAVQRRELSVEVAVEATYSRWSLDATANHVPRTKRASHSPVAGAGDDWGRAGGQSGEWRVASGEWRGRSGDALRSARELSLHRRLRTRLLSRNSPPPRCGFQHRHFSFSNANLGPYTENLNLPHLNRRLGEWRRSTSYLS